MKQIKVGIVGFGTVGAGVAENLLRNHDLMAARLGVDIQLAGIADLDITTDRGVEVPAELLTTDSAALIAGVDIVVELVGGTGFARKLIVDALSAGKTVVTANKALLAEYGDEIFAAAAAGGGNIHYEASVGGGIPVIKALREGLAGNRIMRMYGILNGTCNYILTRMENEKSAFADVLADAQKLGYAEADPTLDIDGFDTAHKAAILTSLACGRWVNSNEIHVEGIRNVEASDIELAAEFGYRLKLLGIMKSRPEGIEVRVHPTLIPRDSMLAGISGVFNGAMIEGDPVGETLYYGRGAGRNATSSAVIADIADAALDFACDCRNRRFGFTACKDAPELLPMDEVISRYWLSVQVKDTPGVVAGIAGALAAEQISIAGFSQREKRSSSEGTQVVFTTHAASEKAFNNALRVINAMSTVLSPCRVLRIEEL